MVGEHPIPEIVQTLPAREPSRRGDHHGIARVERECLLDEEIVDGRGRRAATTASIPQLIGRVADDDVELHVVSEQLGDPSSDVVGMDECVGVSFQVVTACVAAFASTAVGALAVGIDGDLFARKRINPKLAFATAPGVVRAIEPDVAVLGRERPGDRVRAVGELRAIDTPASQQCSELCDPDAENLTGEDVIDALGEVRERQDQSVGEAASDLAKEDPRLGERIEERDIGVGPDVGAVVGVCPRGGKRVEHLVRELRRGEDLIVGEVRDARQHIRVVPSEGERCKGHAAASAI